MTHESNLLSTKQVMAYFSYSDPKGFGEFVKREAVPRQRHPCADPAMTEAVIR